MKRDIMLIAGCLVIFFAAIAVFAQEGFNGPFAPGTAVPDRMQQARAVTVSQLSTVPNKTYVILTGTITQSIGREYYTFRDATGETTVEIENHIWRGLSVGPSDRVELTAQVEIKRGGRIEVEVKSIRKL